MSTYDESRLKDSEKKGFIAKIISGGKSARLLNTILDQFPEIDLGAYTRTKKEGLLKYANESFLLSIMLTLFLAQQPSLLKGLCASLLVCGRLGYILTKLRRLKRDQLEALKREIEAEAELRSGESSLRDFKY